MTAHSHTVRTARAAFAGAAFIALSLLLAGCGNKGPLVLPTASTDAMIEPPADVLAPNEAATQGEDADASPADDEPDADAVEPPRG